MRGEIFRTCPDRPGAHPASCTMGTGSFPEVKCCRDVTLTPHPLLVPWSRKCRAITLLPLWALRPVQSLSACTRVHFTLPTFIQGLSKRFEHLLLWPPSSPDLTPCDFFLWGYVKDNAYKPQTARSHSSCGANH